MTDAPLILLVEDEKPILRFLRASLAANGFRAVEAATGAEALLALRSQPPDLILLDLGLPDMDGAEVIDEVRRWSAVPILVLSARDQEKAKIDALDRGADDYLTKPFGVGELLARLRVALRHAADRAARGAAPGEDGTKGEFESGDLRVDFRARRVDVAGREVHLTRIEFRLLAVLIEHAGKVLTHRFLLQEIWGPGHTDPHPLRVHMANLRRKIEVDPARPRHIHTEQGVGYRLAGE